jgi:hypothetical protein
VALTDLTALKIHMGLPLSDTTDDEFYTQLLSAVEAAFKKLTDREFEAADYLLYLDGTNNSILCLPEYPVITLTGVWLDEKGYWGDGPDAFAAATLLTRGVDYALVKDGKNGDAETGRLKKINGVWPGRWESKQGLLTMAMKPGNGNIKVSARLGYEVIPEDIQLCLWQVCAQLASERETGRAIQSEGFEEYDVAFMANDAMNAMRVGTAAQVVARYRRITPRHRVLG